LGGLKSSWGYKSLLLGWRPGKLPAGTQAAGAEAHTDFFAFLRDFSRLDIGNPAMVGAPLGMAHVMTELAAFAAIIASHIKGYSPLTGDMV
jgi:hypothetical protein